MKEIYLKDLKTILYDGIVLREWNDDAEDFDVLYHVVDFFKSRYSRTRRVMGQKSMCNDFLFRMWNRLYSN